MSPARKVIQNLEFKSKTLSVAESCTGGLLSSGLTDIPGASSVFLGGCVAYHNTAKINILGVSKRTLTDYGAVSQQTALGMAAGVRALFHSDYGIGITGIAGPGGGTAEKPVGLIWVAFSAQGQNHVFQLNLSGTRVEIKKRTVHSSLTRFLQFLA